MDDQNRAAAIAAADRLTNSVSDLGTEMKELRNYGRRNRLLIRALVASMVFDAVLSIGLGWIGVTAHNASNKAVAATAASKVNANNQRQSCLNGNDSRAVQLELWTYIFTLPAGQGQTPEQVERIAEFRKYINTVFAQRDCG